MQPKDTAYSLAKRYNLSVDALLNLNNLRSPNLSVGQTLLVSPPTYTVVRGDTAFNVARRSGLSVNALLSLNHLSGPNLSVGQVLSLSTATGGTATGGTATGSAAAGSPSSSASNTSLSTASLSAASLSTAAAAPDLSSSYASSSATNLPLTEPSLTSPVNSSTTFSTINVTPEPTTTVPLPEPLTPLGAEVTPGQTEQTGPGQTGPNPPLSGEYDWLANAQSLLGVPYAWGGQSRRGTDCSGFVLQVFAPLGLNLPRSSAQQAQVGVAVERSQLQSGDLVFFDTEGRGRVTHVGIALSGGTFINANSYLGKVSIDDLTSRYWATRYLGARRVLGVMASR